ADAEEGPCRLRPVAELTNRVGVRRIEDAELHAGSRKGSCEHLGRQARSPHAKHRGAGVAVVPDVARQVLELPGPGGHGSGQVQPAKTSAHLLRGSAGCSPQAAVLRPQAVGDLLLVPPCEPLCDRRVQRAVAHAGARALRWLSMASMSSSKDLPKAATPSSISSSVTVCMLIPCCSTWRSRSRASSTSAANVRTRRP